MGSGSPSRPQVSISLPSYTLMIRSAVLMRKQLHRRQDRWTKAGRIRDRGKESTGTRTPNGLELNVKGGGGVVQVETQKDLLLILTCPCVQIRLIWSQLCCWCQWSLWRKPPAPECLCSTPGSATTNRGRHDGEGKQKKHWTSFVKHREPFRVSNGEGKTPQNNPFKGGNKEETSQRTDQ